MYIFKNHLYYFIRFVGRKDPYNDIFKSKTAKLTGSLQTCRVYTSQHKSCTSLTMLKTAGKHLVNS